tara:strand:+ start:23787 stop:23903 length:117 start_codon:yes stop_codon:yes gene_type:complete
MTSEQIYCALLGFAAVKSQDPAIKISLISQNTDKKLKK